MRALRIGVTIGRKPKICRHTEQHEGEMCVGCVRRIIDALLGLVHDAQTSDDEALAMGLIEQALLRLDTSLAGVGAIVRAEQAERAHTGGMTAHELSAVRVYGYTLQQVAKAVTIVRQLGLDHELGDREDDEAPKRSGRWRR